MDGNLEHAQMISRKSVSRWIGSAGAMTLAILTLATMGMAQANPDMQAALSKELSGGAKLGLITPGTVDAEGNEFDTDLSYSLGGFVDYRLGPKFYGGAFLDIHNMAAFDDSKTLVDFGLTAKTVFAGDESKVAFRPGLGLGYGNLGSVEGVISGTSYLTVKGFVEALFPTSGGVTWLGELAIFAAPSGGNSDADVTFGPAFLLRGGAAF